MGRLRGLDALRGIAAFIVLAYHLGHAFGWRWLFPKGYLAVDFFFMLSGYVLSRTYDARLANGLASADFLVRRLKRLWPTMAVATVLAAPLLLTYTPETRFVLVVAGLLFVPILASKDYFPLNGPQWSVLFEIIANAAHGFVLHRLSTGLLAGLTLVAAICCGFFAAEMGNLDIGGQSDDVLAGFPRVMMSYGIGMLLWRILHDRSPLVCPSWTAFLALPLAIGGVGLLPGHAWPAEMAFAIVACPAVIVAGLSWDAGRAGAALGTWSFPLYAFHAPVIYGVLSLGLGWKAVLGAAMVLAVMVFTLQRLRLFLQADRSGASSGLAQ